MPDAGFVATFFAPGGRVEEVVEHATRSCDRVRRAVELSQAPFDRDTASRWLDLVDEAMMAR